MWELKWEKTSKQVNFSCKSMEEKDRNYNGKCCFKKLTMQNLRDLMIVLKSANESQTINKETGA